MPPEHAPPQTREFGRSPNDRSSDDRSARPGAQRTKGRTVGGTAESTADRSASTKAGRKSQQASTRRKSPASSFDRGALGPRLEQGLATLGLLPAAQNGRRALTDKLLDYLSLLLRWNTTYNLTAIRDPEQMLTLHLLDSAAIAPPLHQLLLQERPAQDPSANPRSLRIVDVGSGAGLPGIVLAILWPHAHVELVEPVGKKAAFLRQVAAELALTNITVHEARVEALLVAPEPAAPDLIVCRAFASLADFATSIAKLVGPRALVAAMKASDSRDEIAELPLGWRCRETLPLRVPGLDAQRHLILLAADDGADVDVAPASPLIGKPPRP